MISAPVECHVLVADDIPEICEVIETFLQGGGYRVTIVHDGPSARRALEEQHVDLALLDVRMPGEQGTSLARIAQTARVPVILMSGRSESMEEMSNLPYPRLHKPFRLGELEAVIAEALGLPAVNLAASRSHG